MALNTFKCNYLTPMIYKLEQEGRTGGSVRSLPMRDTLAL